MDGLKQRIVGALVLVSLAVIFVPMIFDEPHSERTSNSIQIPEEPPFPEVTVPEDDAIVAPVDGPTGVEGDGGASAASDDEPEPDYRIVETEQAPFEGVPEVDQESEPVAESRVESAPEVSSQAPEDAEVEPEITETSPDAGRDIEAGDWVVQLGSFGNADNARRLSEQVRDKGYGSQLQAVKRGDATLTRVFSGPFPDRASAEAAKRVLDESFSLNSLVTTSDK
ncbi:MULTISPECIES: SPOR domain-containing protein [Marinobacter]|uniref:SPOR domain-containing protein n=1 Tax=Marinobacter suaedae TaxID=3057675 RepID=A0ABT8W243_9GAMM|nr:MULTISPECIES: SPOR domain-containing protein [unclassified Marinobacter]MBZ2167943.1 SPOR domain-containing protein [Marinobacter sp. F4216]MDO3722326.1 SPOR domain-containing protein [Marinobacter sp. chi1]